ncbi:hypothetical protein CDAR_392651 [Caerostris darwini]|uniref:Uncharacterized protein n=1 Tax=Caerostris darwini TaxID=1538125 RepID=A0AAV4PIF0_9ARAC|nr:hypothetical protein CDAR_392651 [Caerostris darwini]
MQSWLKELDGQLLTVTHFSNFLGFNFLLFTITNIPSFSSLITWLFQESLRPQDALSLQDGAVYLYRTISGTRW